MTLQDHCCKSGISFPDVSQVERVDDVCGRRSLSSWIVGMRIRDPCGSAACPTCAVDSVFNVINMTMSLLLVNLDQATSLRWQCIAVKMLPFWIRNKHAVHSMTICNLLYYINVQLLLTLSTPTMYWECPRSIFFKLAAPDRYTNALFISSGAGAELGLGALIGIDNFKNVDFGGGSVSTVLQHAASRTTCCHCCCWRCRCPCHCQWSRNATLESQTLVLLVLIAFDCWVVRNRLSDALQDHQV